MYRILLLIALLVLWTGCGGSGDAPAGGGGETMAAESDGCGEEEDDDEDGGGGGAYTPDKGTATVNGTVRFEGTPPKRRPLDLGAEEFCVAEHQDKPLRSETVIVGKDGGLANVFVHVKSGLRGWKFPKATGDVVLDQYGCQYKPHMLGAQVGQTLKVKNSDPIMHNVHATDMKSGRDFFNWAQAKKGTEHAKALKRASFYRVKCDVHGWMGSHVMVVKHPFFAVTGEDGKFTLAKLPPGTYTIEAWQERLGTQTASVTVKDGETKEVKLSFKK
ncbi:MAG: carboxypeptidase regulatory-like domain-containing protein [Planctomycetota bacterium]